MTFLSRSGVVAGAWLSTWPSRPYNIGHPDPCEQYSLRKHGKYDEGFVGASYLFAALVFETTGGVNREGAHVLRQLFRFAAREQGLHLSVFSGRAWARLSCNLQVSVAQAVLNRSPGLDPRTVQTWRRT